jgi:hypothetical protein
MTDKMNENFKVTGVVGVSPALWYFRYIASIFLNRHKRLWLSLVVGKAVHSDSTVNNGNMQMGLDSLSKLKSYDIVKSAIVMVMIVNPIMKLNIRVNSFSNHQAQPQALVSSQKYACYVPKSHDLLSFHYAN